MVESEPTLYLRVWAIELLIDLFVCIQLVTKETVRERVKSINPIHVKSISGRNFELVYLNVTRITGNLAAGIF